MIRLLDCVKKYEQDSKIFNFLSQQKLWYVVFFRLLKFFNLLHGFLFCILDSPFLIDTLEERMISGQVDNCGIKLKVH